MYLRSQGRWLLTLWTVLKCCCCCRLLDFFYLNHNKIFIFFFSSLRQFQPTVWVAFWCKVSSKNCCWYSLTFLTCSSVKGQRSEASVKRSTRNAINSTADKAQLHPLLAKSFAIHIFTDWSFLITVSVILLDHDKTDPLFQGKNARSDQNLAPIINPDLNKFSCTMPDNVWCCHCQSSILKLVQTQTWDWSSGCLLLLFIYIKIEEAKNVSSVFLFTVRYLPGFGCACNQNDSTTP